MPRFVAADDEAFSIPLVPAQIERLAPTTLERLIAGVRPEDLRIATTTGSGTAIRAIVEASEPLGNEVLLYLRAGGQDVTARAEPHALARPGDRLSLTIDPERVHYFDRASGRSI
jgi:multiple sugar transport system ATP-binding protein